MKSPKSCSRLLEAEDELGVRQEPLGTLKQTALSGQTPESLKQKTEIDVVFCLNVLSRLFAQEFQKVLAAPPVCLPPKTSGQLSGKTPESLTKQGKSRHASNFACTCLGRDCLLKNSKPFLTHPQCVFCPKQLLNCQVKPQKSEQKQRNLMHESSFACTLSTKHANQTVSDTTQHEIQMCKNAQRNTINNCKPWLLQGLMPTGHRFGDFPTAHLC